MTIRILIIRIIAGDSISDDIWTVNHLTHEGAYRPILSEV
jgi:hypothetical protein